MSDGPQIGVGLDWQKKLFFQEYWYKGSVHYWIANDRSDAAKITIHEWKNRRAGIRLAGPWDVKPGEVVSVDARALVGSELVCVLLSDHTNLGLLRGPAPPTDRKPDKIVTTAGLNGSGGTSTDMWLEQDQLSFPPDDVAELRLICKAGSGVIHFGRTQQVNHPPPAAVESALSKTVPVTVTDNDVRIDTNTPTKEEKRHTITLRFRTPAVSAQTLAAITGRVRTSPSSSYVLSRGIVVEPRK
jgi:hypothetical protein